MDTLDGRYSRMSGKGSPFGAFLDSTLDRLEEGIVLIAVGAYFAAKHNQVAARPYGRRGARLADGVLHPRSRRGARCRVQGRARDPSGEGRDHVDRARVRRGASLGHFELLAPAVYVLAGADAFTTMQRILHVAFFTCPAAERPGPSRRRGRCNRTRSPLVPTRRTTSRPLAARTLREGINVSTTNGFANGAAPLPEGQGPGRDHRRRQLRELVRAGRPLLPRRRPRRRTFPG